MRCTAVAVASLAALLSVAVTGRSAPPARGGLPPPVVPQGWGVNIHFTDPEPGEIARFAEAGYRIARMDLFWAQVEKTPGVYDFAAYDRLVAALARAGARPLFILDYGNPLYDENRAPHSAAGRAAFARFAGAAAAHFRGKGVLWEIWNEPNGSQFWRPRPNPDDYAALAIATAKAVRAADRDAVILAPAAAGFPWEFLEAVFRRGLLAHIDAVSVHPYRGQAPETAASDYARLRILIARHAPAHRRDLPIVSSEWGYSTFTGGVTEERQAQYLTRQWLSNLASGVNLSIFYDWRDDGDDPNENEHRFGTVRRDLTPKPSFLAARKLIAALDGFAFRHRLRTGWPQDWRLLFQKGNALKVVVWTTDEKAPERDRTPEVLTITPGTKGQETLRRVGAIRYAAGVQAASENIPARFAVTVSNPESKPARLRVTVGGATRNLVVSPGAQRRLIFPLTAPPLRDAAPTPVPVEVRWNGERLADLPTPYLYRTDPLIVAAAPREADLFLSIENPAGTAFTGTVAVIGGARPVSRPLSLAAGTTRAEVILPSPGEARHTLEIRDQAGRVVLRTAPRRYLPLPGFPKAPGDPAAHRLVLSVENAAQPPQPLSVVATPPDSPAAAALAFRYEFATGWRYAQAVPERTEPIPPGAIALTLWVRADNNGDFLRARYRDSTGQTFQQDIAKMDWTGWRLVTIPLSGRHEVHWGGANDGVPHPPLTWDGLILVDSATREIAHRGEVLLAAPTYVLEN